MRLKLLYPTYLHCRSTIMQWFNLISLIIIVFVLSSISDVAIQARSLEKRQTTSVKRGLSWPWNNPASSFALFSPSRIPWLYNWELWDPRGAGVYAGAEYVPMCRTTTQSSQVPQYFSNCYAKKFIGFNEPDLPPSYGRNYVSPCDAANL